MIQSLFLVDQFSVGKWMRTMGIEPRVKVQEIETEIDVKTKAKMQMSHLSWMITQLYEMLMFVPLWQHHLLDRHTKQFKYNSKVLACCSEVLKMWPRISNFPALNGWHEHCLLSRTVLE